MHKGAHKDEVHKARDSHNSVLGTVYTFRFKNRMDIQIFVWDLLILHIRNSL